MVPFKKFCMQPSIAFLQLYWEVPEQPLIAHSFWLLFTIQCCCLLVLICSGTFSEHLLPLYKVVGASLLRNNKRYVSTIDFLKPSRSSLISPGCRSRSLLKKTIGWPPPFHDPQIEHVWWNILIHVINTPHILIVDIYHLSLLEMNFFSLFPTKSLNDCLRFFSRKSRNHVYCFVVFPPNCINMRCCTWNISTSHFNSKAI